MPRAENYDVLIVGAGIVGLAHALAANRAGLKTAVVDRDACAAGASVRNFGFVTVTGQEAGITWRRSRRSRDIWAEVAAPAGIVLHQRGLLVCARRAEALACLEEFAATPMGAQCRLLSPAEVAGLPGLRPDLHGALHSPHELRVESRRAIGQLTAWLAAQGVEFHTRTAAIAAETGIVVTRAGRLHARHVIVCPGTDLVSLFPEVIARRRTTLCKLHMLRLAPPGPVLPAPVMSDLGAHPVPSATPAAPRYRPCEPGLPPSSRRISPTESISSPCRTATAPWWWATVTTTATRRTRSSRAARR